LTDPLVCRTDGLTDRRTDGRTDGRTYMRDRAKQRNGKRATRSSKVIDLGANRKRTRNFPLLFNSNFGRISYRFDIDA